MKPLDSAAQQKVLLVHRFYAPDVTTYAQMLKLFAQHLANEGHDVTVFCGPPSYNGAYSGPPVPRRQRKHGVTVLRARIPGANTQAGKLLGSLLFPLAVAMHVVSRRQAYNVVSVTTVPPILMGLAGRVGAARSHRTRLVYHCMDLYPEVAATLGVAPNSWLGRLARRLDNATIAAADRTIVLSGDMLQTLVERGAPTNSVAVCNNFILEEADSAAPTTVEPSSSHRMIFAGNLGRFQGIETLVDAFEIIHRTEPTAELVFLGAGALSGWIEEEAATRGLRIHVHPHLPLREAMSVIHAADTAIVSLAPGVIKSAYPSKLLMYLELGRQILAVVEDESELAATIEESNLGLAVPPGDPEAIAGAMSKLIGSPTEDAGRIQAEGRRLFGRDTILERWTDHYGLGRPS